MRCFLGYKMSGFWIKTIRLGGYPLLVGKGLETPLSHRKLGKRGFLEVFGGFWPKRVIFGQKRGVFVKIPENWVFLGFLEKPSNSYSKNVISSKSTKSRFRIGIWRFLVKTPHFNVLVGGFAPFWG